MFYNRECIPFFSLEYSLKSELKQYFDLVKINKIYLKLDLPISVFSEGGVGTSNFIKNTEERVKVIYKEAGFMGVLYFLQLNIISFIFLAYKSVVSK